MGRLINATHVVDALAQVRDLLTDAIPGRIEAAQVVHTEGLRLPPGRLFGRRRF
jgi:hypothetical protein